MPTGLPPWPRAPLSPCPPGAPSPTIPHLGRQQASCFGEKSGAAIRSSPPSWVNLWEQPPPSWLQASCPSTYPAPAEVLRHISVHCGHRTVAEGADAVSFLTSLGPGSLHQPPPPLPAQSGPTLLKVHPCLAPGFICILLPPCQVPPKA